MGLGRYCAEAIEGVDNSASAPKHNTTYKRVTDIRIPISAPDFVHELTFAALGKEPAARWEAGQI